MTAVDMAETCAVLRAPNCVADKVFNTFVVSAPTPVVEIFDSCLTDKALVCVAFNTDIALEPKALICCVFNAEICWALSKFI